MQLSCNLKLESDAIIKPYNNICVVVVSRFPVGSAKESSLSTPLNKTSL
jgi:hypothetical protein